MYELGKIKSIVSRPLHKLAGALPAYTFAPLRFLCKRLSAAFATSRRTSATNTQFQPNLTTPNGKSKHNPRSVPNGMEGAVASVCVRVSVCV